MDLEKINKLIKIDKKILQCQECSFHKDLKDKNLYYKPEALCYLPKMLEKADFKVISIGLNPGWNKWNETIRSENEYQILYQMPISSDKEYLDYVKIFNKALENDKGRGQYEIVLGKTLCSINKKINIYNGVSEKEIIDNLYPRYLFRANLSFCNSKKLNERIFWNKAIKCNVLSEEIPNCLDKGFLKEIVDCLQPELVIFFGNYYTLTPKNIVERLSGVASEEIKFNKETFTLYEKKNGKKIQADVSIYYSRKIITKFIFLPHPRCPWKDNYREKAIKWACSELKNNQ